jgi:DNA-binding transcriptional ArsR family regulator
MKAGPDIARVAALIGDPARANMLSALMSGRALTASELAAEAGITPPTASSHLAKLEQGGLVVPEKQGRHRYFRLSGVDVAAALEQLMGLASRAGHLRTRPGPKDPDLRRARVCYDHLAGDMGVAFFDSLTRRNFIETEAAAVRLTGRGRAFFEAFGLDVEALESLRRPLCRTCLDWSARRSHLAGSLAAAVLARIDELGWVRREPGSRIVRFTPRGMSEFRRLCGAAAR